MEENYLFKHDATFYAEQIIKQEESVHSLVQNALTAIEQWNPRLNAVTQVQAETALAQAEQYDTYLSRLSDAEVQQLPPFYGVPILLKDLGQNQAKQPSASGSKLFKEHQAKITDHFVKRIEAAGFIVVGRTNVPEFGFKNISDSREFGAVASPIDLKYNPGGSSGGAAAALKAGLVPIVTASDGGGSIRIPASFTGLIGLKTSRGRIPVGPFGYRGWQGASVNFALTKSVRDTWRLLKWMQVEQIEAPFTMGKIVETELTPPTRPLKIAYSTRSPIGGKVSDEAVKAVKQTVKRLTALGHQVIEAEPSVDGIQVMRDYYVMNSVETGAMMQAIEEQRQEALTYDDMEPISWGLFQAGLKVSGIEYSKVIDSWDRLAADTDAFFVREAIDLVLMPSTADVAPVQGQFELTGEQEECLRNMAHYNSKEQQAIIWQVFDKSLALTPFTQQQNLTGQPAISLPVWKTASGFPLGVQFSARKGQEFVLLQLALQLEQAGFLSSQITESD